jgi:hypothetical protein
MSKITSAPFDGITKYVYCPNDSGCPAIPIELKFVLPAWSNSIQFVFQGGDLSITAPAVMTAVPEPDLGLPHPSAEERQGTFRLIAIPIRWGWRIHPCVFRVGRQSLALRK